MSRKCTEYSTVADKIGKEPSHFKSAEAVFSHNIENLKIRMRRY